jgi:hypothetical protein
MKIAEENARMMELCDVLPEVQVRVNGRPVPVAVRLVGGNAVVTPIERASR